MTQLLAKLLDRARHSVATQLALGGFVGFVLPTLLLVLVASAFPGVTGIALYIVALAYLLTCALMLVEANLAIRRGGMPDPPPPSDGWQPSVTLLVVAYLPNEVGIVKETLRSLCALDLPGEHSQVLLAYNTPEPLAIEPELRQMAAEIDRLDVIRVERSGSKAENVMGALPHIRGEVVAILDTDHQLRGDAAMRAIRWFDAGYDIVQGRCVIRNARESALTRMVALEFELIYGVAHSGRSLLVDTGIFGGANGWWRTNVLQAVGLDARMLTEDIDSSIRSLLAGYRIVHDRSVVSTELAPPSLGVWWRQRTRWAQGWFQVTLRHSQAMRATPFLPLPTRIYWGVMLTWRELFPFVSLQLFAIVTAELLLGGSLKIASDPFLIFSTVITLGCGFLLAAAAWRVATPESRTQMGWPSALIGASMSMPYTVLRNAVAIAAIVRELVGDRRWLVTRRADDDASSTSSTSLREKDMAWNQS